MGADRFAALIIAITPIWFLLLEAFVFRGDRLSRRGLFGVALGIAGVAILFWPSFEQRATLGMMPLIGSSILLLSSFSWSVGSVASRKWQMKVDPFTATAGRCCSRPSATPSSPLAAAKCIASCSRAAALLAVLYLVVFGSWVGYTAYIWLLKHVPTPKVATYAYVNPLVAVFLGWLVLDERLDAFLFAGTVIIVGAVALVTTAKVHEGGSEQSILTGLEPEA